MLTSTCNNTGSSNQPCQDVSHPFSNNSSFYSFACPISPDHTTPWTLWRNNCSSCGPQNEGPAPVLVGAAAWTGTFQVHSRKPGRCRHPFSSSTQIFCLPPSWLLISEVQAALWSCWQKIKYLLTCLNTWLCFD